jgi:hypothetical protein
VDIQSGRTTHTGRRNARSHHSRDREHELRMMINDLCSALGLLHRTACPAAISNAAEELWRLAQIQRRAREKPL